MCFVFCHVFNIIRYNSTTKSNLNPQTLQKLPYAPHLHQSLQSSELGR